MSKSSIILLNCVISVETENILKVSVGEIPIWVYSENSDFIDQSREEYTNFFSEEIAPKLIIKVQLISFDDLKNLDYPDQVPQIEVDSSREACKIYWNNFCGYINLKEKVGTVQCIDQLGLNSFLRFVYSIILLNEQGFLIHASSLIRNGKGYLFPGKSGAGKTTITKLSQDSKLLTDDISLIKKIDGKFEAFSTPFWGELKLGVENTSTPVNDILFPIQDKSNYLEHLSNLEALKMLLVNILFFAEDEVFNKQLFDLSYDFINSVKAYKLHFLPEPSFWRVVQ